MLQPKAYKRRYFIEDSTGILNAKTSVSTCKLQFSHTVTQETCSIIELVLCKSVNDRILFLILKSCNALQRLLCNTMVFCYPFFQDMQRRTVLCSKILYGSILIHPLSLLFLQEYVFPPGICFSVSMVLLPLLKLLFSVINEFCTLF